MTVDFKALAAKAAATTDMTKAQTGGGAGDYQPPAAGPVRLRFIGYVETGKHKESFQGQEKIRAKCLLTFELSGPKHQPTVAADGTKTPLRISIEETISLNEKANFYKLFQKLNYSGKATHIAQLLGEAYKGTIIHRKYAKAGEDKSDPSKWTGVSAELKSKTEGYTIQAPRVEDPDTGEYKTLAVAPALTPIKLFLWDYADKAQWDSLYIDGSYPPRTAPDGTVISPGRSKNVYQERIKAAVNFPGSPIHAVLAAGGQGGGLDLPDVDSKDEPDHGGDPAPWAAASPTEDDVLNGIV